MVSEKRKEVVKELLRRRFEETKEQVSKNAEQFVNGLRGYGKRRAGL